MPGQKLLTMSPLALRGVALEWFLRGFECSGYRFHGERENIKTSRAVRRLIGIEFSRQWSQRKG